MNVINNEINLDTMTYEEWKDLELPPADEWYVNRVFGEDRVKLVICLKMDVSEGSLYEKFQKYWKIRGGRELSTGNLSENQTFGVLIEYLNEFDRVDRYRFNNKIRNYYSWESPALSRKKFCEIILECIDLMQCRYSVIKG